MAVEVRFNDPRDAARIVDALHSAADRACVDGLPLLARRYEAIAESLGDAIDASAVPPITAGYYLH